MTARPNDRVAELLAVAEPPWLAPAVAEWLADPDAAPLHAALDLDRAGHCRTLRDYYLVAAWRVTAPTGSPWRRALDLAAAVRAFGSRVWTRTAGLTEPDPGWSAQRRAIWQAFRAAGSVGVPESPDRIKQIVESAGIYIPQMPGDNDRRKEQSREMETP